MQRPGRYYRRPGEWRAIAPPPPEVANSQMTPFLIGWTGKQVALYGTLTGEDRPPAPKRAPSPPKEEPEAGGETGARVLPMRRRAG